MGAMKYLFPILTLLLLPFSAFADDYIIPALIGQTGASSTFGKAELDGYTLAIEEWNALHGGIDGKPVSLKVEDTRSDSATILTGFHRLAALGYKVVLGPTWMDGPGQGVIPVAEKKSILLVSPSAEYEALKSGTNWPITFYYHSRAEAVALVDYLACQKINRLSIVVEQEPFAELFRKLVVEASAGKLEIVNEVEVRAGESDFKSILPRLGRNSPQAHLVLVWDESSLITLLKTLKSIASDLPLVTIHDGEGWLSKPDFAALISKMVYSRFVISDRAFFERFRRRFGYDVYLTGSNAYDAMWSVLRALQSGARDARAVREFIVTNKLETVTFGKIQLAREGYVTASEVEVVEHPSKKSKG
jgi:ABC-type branched-subunit amino acid transport system substrate-binding protein